MRKQPRIYLTVEGETLSVPEWSKRTGASADTIYWRLRNGVSPDDAIVPVRDVYAENSTERYTPHELYELYKRFAGAEDELQMLADFSGVTTDEAEELLDRFRKKRAGR